MGITTRYPSARGDRLYLEVDGHLCPTREPKDGPDAQGYRGAEAGLAFSGHDVAEVSKERHEILHKLLQAQITDSEAFRSLFTEVYRHARGEQAAEVIVLADGARWIWNLVEDLLPRAVQKVTELMLAGDSNTALYEHYRLLPVHKSLFVEPNPQLVKAVLAARGKMNPAIRLPLVEASKEARENALAALQAYEAGK